MRIAAVDLIITGEGKLDAQTLHGKGPMGVAEMAGAMGKPVIGIGGVIEAREELRSRFEALFQVKPDSLPVSEAMKQGRELLSAATREQLVPWLKKRA